MGMGKSLSILALITKTLDDGKEWAQQQNDSAEGKALKHSRSTLVVVPSARTRPSFSNRKGHLGLTWLVLIYNWMKEIAK
jgi:SWI/SNF-related matrix-associated actin-dependent regulator of chromatin subfamily A3